MTPSHISVAKNSNLLSSFLAGTWRGGNQKLVQFLHYSGLQGRDINWKLSESMPSALGNKLVYEMGRSLSIKTCVRDVPRKMHIMSVYCNSNS